ncbi:hypothetical protein [Luteimicrobium subarcticum]|uniref:Fibronectin type-III domain-containing protein n=1 Tax=Luteimicrobium subarcticum TaxID=620910 RepID=A0A2M8WTC7_9MICO|nr:hypothetical protein [Luteimicrobium subarcticum]PJI94215.1 hypothetical protein CLV34_1703 [Luteimicrobium subarcticum]
MDHPAPLTVSAPWGRLVRGATVALLGFLALLGAQVAQASDARADETPGVAATCSGLVVKPHGYVDKGEVRIVVDGEGQTDGGDDGWTEFKGSFPGVYLFEPDVPHDYTVEVNSYAADSGGRTFTPGIGGDVEVTGPTVPCSPVDVAATTTVCAYDWQAEKQSIDLTMTNLRAHVTYLVEVLHEGDVVTHFQFRNAPTELKTFSLLHAGTDYQVRVTDQTNGVLSRTVDVPVPGCAARAAVTAAPTACTPDGLAGVSVVLADLVPGRDYVVGLARSGGSDDGARSTALHATATATSVVFPGVAAGTYVPSLADADAPRVVRAEPVVVGSCSPSGADPAPGGGAGAAGSGTGSGDGAGDAAGSGDGGAAGTARPSGLNSSAAAAPGAVSAPGGADGSGTASVRPDAATAGDGGPGDDAAAAGAPLAAAGGSAADPLAAPVTADAGSSALGIGLSALAVVALGAAAGCFVVRRRTNGPSED